MDRPAPGCTLTTTAPDELVWSVLPAPDGWHVRSPSGTSGPPRPTLAEAVAKDLPPDLVRPDRGLTVHTVGVDPLEVVHALRCPVAVGGFDLDAVAEAWAAADLVEWVEGLGVAGVGGTVAQLSTVRTRQGPCVAVWPADGSAPAALVQLDQERGVVAPGADHLESGWWTETSMMVSAGGTEEGAQGPRVWTCFEWSDEGPASSWLEYVADGTASDPARVAAALQGRVHVYLRTTVGFPARAAEVDDAGEPEMGTTVQVCGSADFRRAVFDLVCADPRAQRAVDALRDPGTEDGRAVDDALVQFLYDGPVLTAVNEVLAGFLGERPDV